ncbi:glycosyltransferase family 1 protein [Nitrosopumilus sp.]|nr:glycosyltransferase family 1 protein [Nitrosopumilus sp.]
MRIGIVIDWNIHASSLMRINCNMFRELGKLMNKQQNFTITALRKNTLGIGDINQHYDCIHIPNMGGYAFPTDQMLSAKNLILGPSGIDEVIYGEEVFFDKSLWKIHEPLIKKEILRWPKHIDKISSVHVVAKSEFNEMNQYLKIPKEKMTVISHGVDHNHFKLPENKSETRKKILKKFDLTDEPYFIHVSETNYVRKNLFRMLDGFKKAKEKKIPQKLILVGKTLPSISKKIQEYDDVIALGFVSDDELISLMQGSDAIILPSIHEGFGMPLLEAMACGIPSITMNNHAPPEIVEDSGLLVDSHSVDDIALKMVQINQDEMLTNLSKKALSLSKKYSWEIHAKEIFNLYLKSTEFKKNWNFDENYEIAAYRTITTLIELFAVEKKDFLTQSLLNFDYPKIISWALEFGLLMPQCKDILLPFKDWLISKNLGDK